MYGERPSFWVSIGVMLLALSCLVVMFVYSITAAHAAIDPAETSPRIIDIQNDPGGNVAEYYNNFKKLSEAGTIVRLHGYCASACTLVLLREYTGIKACAADENAIFAFHKPYMFDKRGKIVHTKASIRTARAMWAEMLAHFPYDVWNLLKDARIPSASEGDSQDDLFTVPVIFFLPKCAQVAE